MRHIIVGVDTGKASSIAGIDLNGRVIGTTTMKCVGVSWFVNKIKELGSPVVIATDKKKS